MRPIIEGKLTPESDELAYIKDSLVIDEKSEIEVERRMKIFDAVGDFMTQICPAAVDTKEKTREVGLALGVAFATYFQEEA
jgi:hypothetical protein